MYCTSNLIYYSCSLLLISATGQYFQDSESSQPGEKEKEENVCRKRGMVDMATSRNKRTFADVQQRVLHDTAAGTEAKALQASGTPAAGNLSVHCLTTLKCVATLNVCHRAIHHVNIMYVSTTKLITTLYCTSHACDAEYLSCYASTTSVMSMLLFRGTLSYRLSTCYIHSLT